LKAKAKHVDEVGDNYEKEQEKIDKDIADKQVGAEEEKQQSASQDQDDEEEKVEPQNSNSDNEDDDENSDETEPALVKWAEVKPEEFDEPDRVLSKKDKRKLKEKEKKFG